jgi:hypothetical protein
VLVARANKRGDYLVKFRCDDNLIQNYWFSLFRHAGPDTANVRDVLLAEPQSKLALSISLSNSNHFRHYRRYLSPACRAEFEGADRHRAVVLPPNAA